MLFLYFVQCVISIKNTKYFRNANLKTKTTKEIKLFHTNKIDLP